MLELRMAVFPNATDIYWYAHLGSLPFHEAITNSAELPCDLSEFKRSCETPGLYCLFRCSCGDRSCHSAWVDVIHEECVLRWTNIFSNSKTGTCGLRIGSVDWTFERDQYTETILTAEKVTSVARLLVIQETEQIAASDGP